MTDLDKLNPRQREAVLATEGPLLVLAGAGSGKTRVLTYRIARLIDMGVPPWAIMAITFTNKAAREMKERIIALCGDTGRDVWASTFHSSCARMLRRDIEKLGYTRSFSIYDDDDQMSVIKRILKELDLNDKLYPPRDIKTMISDAKDKLLTPNEWLKEAGEDFKTIKKRDVFARYEKTLKDSNALDFDDLIFKTVELFVEHPPVLEAYQNRFRYILVDEYQDTNLAQYRLVHLLAGEKRNVCVVGDDDQSIYGWRGADIRNILEFERDYPGCKVIKLEQNYRSTANILDAANQVIAHNAGRKEKTLWTEADPGEQIALFEGDDERVEAAWLVSEIAKCVKGGCKFGDVAILYRVNAQSRVIEEALVRSGIKYRVYGGMKFYERKEVKDLVAYLRAVTNPDDDAAVRRIINEPKRAIGESTVEELAAYANLKDVSLFNAVMNVEEVGLKARARTAVEQFASLMGDMVEKQEELPPDQFLRFVIEKTGYDAQFKQAENDENTARLQNIAELETAVAEFAKANPEGGLEAFLENVALVTELDGMTDGDEVVTLMTLHSAKGLEFDVVFLVGMEEGVFPTSRALYDDERMEEERRLCYVGMTRARKKLYLSCARSRALYNQRNYNQKSRFIDEIPKRVLRDALVRPQTRVAPPRQAAAGPIPRAAQEGMRRAAQNAAARQGTPGQASPIKGAPLNIPGVSKGVPKLFQVGDRVRHAKFGEGQVTRFEGKHMTIRFADGREVPFATDLAPVIKISSGEGKM